MFNQLQIRLARDLTYFRELHKAGEDTDQRIARGTVLDQMAGIIRTVAAMAQPDLILAIERHCEQFDLEYFSTRQPEKDSRINSLRMIRSVQDAMKAPFDPTAYRDSLVEDLGARNMDKFVAVPQDAVHLFVKSQTQKLTKAPGRMATAEEQEYFYARREALKVALRVHSKNCEHALEQSKNTSDPGGVQNRGADAD